MADINVNVVLPDPISVDVTSPTQALATNVSVPGPQGPAGPRGFTPLINGISGESISLSGQDGIIISSDQSTNSIYVSGNSGYFQSAVNSLTTNLQSTGSNLYTLLTNFSGNLDATYATDLQLYNTGSTLNNRINSLSGYAASIVNLASTGSTLNNRINSLSGWSASAENLASTGSILDIKINNLSGYINSTDSNIVFTTGDQTINGIKTFNDNIIVNQTGIFSAVDLDDVDELNISGVDISIYDGSIDLNDIDEFSISGVDVIITDGSLFASNLVYNTGNQTISGVKTFTDGTLNISIKPQNSGIEINNGPFILRSAAGTYGPVRVEILNENGANGFTVINEGLELADFGLKGSNSKKINFRMEGRSYYANGNNQEFQIIDVSDDPNGVYYARFGNNNIVLGENTEKIGIGTLSPTEKLEVDGNILGNNLVYNTGNQTISGVKTFDTRPTVNGTGVLLSGEAASLPTTIVYTTGNQLINGTKTFNSGVVINVQPTGTNPALYITGTWNNASQVYSGISLNITDTASNSTSSLMDLQVGGTNRFSVDKNGKINIYTSTNNGTASISNLSDYKVQISAQDLYLNAAYALYTTALNVHSQIGLRNVAGLANADVFIARDAANILAQRNGTNAQQFRVYNSTGTNSGEFGLFGWQNNDLIVGTQNTSSGIARNIALTGAPIIEHTQLRLHSGSIASIAANDVTKIQIGSQGLIYGHGASTSAGIGSWSTSAGFRLGGLATVAWGGGGVNSQGLDVILIRDAAGILAQRNGTSAQQLRIYNSTGTNSGEFGLFGWQNNQLIIGSQATSSGILRNVVVTGNNVLLNGNNINVTTNGAIALPFITEPQTFGNNFVGMYNGNGPIVFCGGTAGNTRVAAIGAYSTTAGIGIAPTASLFFGTNDRLAGGNFVGDIYLTRNSAGVINQASSSTPQQYRIFNSTGTNSGEFGLFGWQNNNLIIGPQQTNSGILRDLTLTGNNININASGVLNVFDNTNIVGNLTVSGNTTITGHLSAASKSFLIDHPTQVGKKLQYGSLESPYHGIRLTDKNKISADSVQVNLPDYISALVNEDKVNVQLTNINHDKVLFVKEVNVNQNNFIVGMNRGWFDKNEYEFYWSFTAERKDIPKLTVEF